MLPSGPEDGLNSCVFPLATLLKKRLALEPYYPSSLIDRLDEQVGNIVHSTGRYDVVTLATTTFFRMFL